MQQTLQTLYTTCRSFVTTHRKWLLISCAAALVTVVLLIAFCYRLITPYERYILPANSPQQTRVGLVLGAGVRPDGKPYKELRSRLDTAATALQRGQVDVLLVSGDNRIERYDEPTAMRRYLTEVRGVPADKIVTDFAGRSTYESCERASKVFDLKEVTLISARSHLSRAIYLCRHFGIEAYGLASPVEANNSWRREMLARVKAVLNVYVRGEPTVLGDRIRI
jgi:vancomycin permeability regulator SanA